MHTSELLCSTPGTATLERRTVLLLVVEVLAAVPRVDG